MREHLWLLMYKHKSGVIVWRAFTFKPSPELIRDCYPSPKEEFELEQLDMDLNVIEDSEITA
jgi:hypothetical protein